MKELGSKIKRALTGVHKRFVVIDFKKKLVKFRKKREDKDQNEKKWIPFSQLLDAKVVSQDDSRLNLEYGYKILVQAM